MATPHPGDFLAVMNRRSEVLAVMDEHPTSKRELESELDVSRSTVDRGIRELADKDLVERTADGYRRTLVGRLALQDYEGFAQRVTGLCDGADLLTELPPCVELDPAFLAGATVVESEVASPHRPIEELYEYVEAATKVQGFAPAIHPQQIATYSSQVTEHGMDAEVILTETAVERMLAEYDDALQEGLAHDRVAFYRAAGDLPYSVTVATLPERTVAGVMLYGSSGVSGCILNDDPEAVAWARDRFERERDRAVELEPQSVVVD